MGVLACLPVITLRINASFLLRQLWLSLSGCTLEIRIPYCLPHAASHPSVEYRPPIYRAGEACNPVLGTNTNFKRPPLAVHRVQTDTHTHRHRTFRRERVCVFVRKKEWETKSKKQRETETVRQSAGDRANSLSDFHWRLRACSEEITRDHGVTGLDRQDNKVLHLFGSEGSCWKTDLGIRLTDGSLLDKLFLYFELATHWTAWGLKRASKRKPRFQRTYTTALSKTGIKPLPLKTI